jgi:hypothetical protein
LTESPLQGTLPADTTVGEEETMTVELDVQKIYGELSQVRRELGALKNAVEQLSQAIRARTATEHAHIVRIPAVHGGRPVVRGTGVSVQAMSSNRNWDAPRNKSPRISREC